MREGCTPRRAAPPPDNRRKLTAKLHSEHPPAAAPRVVWRPAVCDSTNGSAAAAARAQGEITPLTAALHVPAEASISGITAMSLDASIEAAVAACTTLTPDECRRFLEKGYVVVKQAFPRELAAEVRDAAWAKLEGEGIVKGDPASWQKTPYVRTGGAPQVRRLLH